MCFDGKTQALAKRLKQHVLDLVDNPDRAQEMIDEYKRERNSQISRLAELFYENQGRFGIERAVAQVRRHPETKLSALRGAIVEVLKTYIGEQAKGQPEELELIGTGLLFEQPVGALALA